MKLLLPCPCNSLAQAALWFLPLPLLSSPALAISSPLAGQRTTVKKPPNQKPPQGRASGVAAQGGQVRG